MKHLDVCSRRCASDEFLVGHFSCLSGVMVGRSLCLSRADSVDISTQSAIMMYGDLAMSLKGDLTQAELRAAMRDEVALEMNHSSGLEFSRVAASEGFDRRLEGSGPGPSSQRVPNCTSNATFRDFAFEMVFGNSSVLDLPTTDQIDPQRIIDRLRSRLENFTGCLVHLQWQQKPFLFVDTVARTDEGQLVIDATDVSLPSTSSAKYDSSEMSGVAADWMVVGALIASSCCCLGFACACYRFKMTRRYREEEPANSPRPPPSPVLLASGACVSQRVADAFSKKVWLNSHAEDVAVGADLQPGDIDIEIGRMESPRSEGDSSTSTVSI